MIFLYSRERPPCRILFNPDHAFPRAVLGPVDFLALLRLEAIRAGVSVGDLRKDMAGPSFKARSVYTLMILLSSK